MGSSSVVAAAKEVPEITTASPITASDRHQKSTSPYEVVREVAGSNAVVVFSMSGCCMCTVVKRLLFGLGVGPTIVELDHLASGAPDIQAVLFHLLQAGRQPVPAVFVGGKYLGGIETLMACHINGSLVPLLKDAGALWL
ncbi:unnamed protein product [Linum tenue]|uniref:Glutaredoxin domain-containing protein n=1 Tax=Linum tenue TaxID=586396 RepID=A0AAV0QJ83_9ROSI|nr:unnamed protein product [Linum tenue]